MNEFQFDLKRTLSRINIFGFPLGILLSTCTKLRFGGLYVGIGELVLSIVTFSTIILMILRKENEKFSKNIKLFYLFWIASFLSMIIGVVMGYNLVPNYVFEESLHDFFAYLFTCIIITINWGGNINSFERLKSIVRSYLVFIFLYFTLILIAITKSNFTLFGIDFSYFNIRVSGLSENPNQLACFCIVIPFLIIYQLQNENKVFNKLNLWVLFLLTVLIGIATLSDALMLSWGVAGLLSIVIWYLKFNPIKFKSNFVKTSIFFIKYAAIPVVFTVITGIFMYNALEYADDVYDDGGQGSDRTERWQNGLKAIKLSPFFGFGPGSYSGPSMPFEKEEAHNSLIDWALSTGVVGLLFFMILMSIYFIKLYTNRILFCGILSICIFVMFGYFLRHPFFWFNIILFVELSDYHRRKDFKSNLN